MTTLRRLGQHGPQVFPLALGCMGMSRMYGPADDAESIATIHAALERGINLLDTGDFYASGHNEALVGRAIADRRDRVLLSVKFGALRTPDGGWGGVDGRPAAVKNFAAYSLQRLGVDHIDIYRLARLDPQVPIEDTIGAIAELVKSGHVRHIGLSELGADAIRRAAAVHPIVDLQIEYSLLSRGPEAQILPTLAELGIGMTAYGVLSRGLLAGSRPQGPGDFRSYLPRFNGENLAQNQRLVDAHFTAADTGDRRQFAAADGSLVDDVGLGCVDQRRFELRDRAAWVRLLEQGRRAGDHRRRTGGAAKGFLTNPSACHCGEGRARRTDLRLDQVIAHGRPT